MYWRLGKVDELIVGRDGSTRGVKLTVISEMGAQGTFYRPIQKIISFEINEITKDEISERCSTESRELRYVKEDSSIKTFLEEVT